MTFAPATPNHVAAARSAAVAETVCGPDTPVKVARPDAPVAAERPPTVTLAPAIGRFESSSTTWTWSTPSIGASATPPPEIGLGSTPPGAPSPPSSHAASPARPARRGRGASGRATSWRTSLGGDDAVRVRDAAPGEQRPGEVVGDDTREEERRAERPHERAPDRGGGAAPAPGQAGRRGELIEEEVRGEEEVDALVGRAAVPGDGREAARRAAGARGSRRRGSAGAGAGTTAASSGRGCGRAGTRGRGPRSGGEPPAGERGVRQRRSRRADRACARGSGSC